uniref:Uncharacterized protein n=1 Tax=Periophthalmus magnuspinnatus TaxID=409849 RepID=A0A3B4AUH6_9GOBI
MMAEIVELLSDKLDLANSHVCMREAALLQYYLQGMCWAQDAHLSPLQTSFTMAVLDTLLHNVTGQTTFVSSLNLEEYDSGFLHDLLFQKYQLFKALSSGQEELLLSIELRFIVVGILLMIIEYVHFLISLLYYE